MRQKKQLTKKEVSQVAKLAKLIIRSSEIKKFQKQLFQVLNYVAILKEVNTSGVEPTSQVTGLENVFREDEIGPSLTQEEALSGTKNKGKGMFKIKAIFN